MKRPGAGGSREKVAQRPAGKAEQAGQADPREEQRARRADQCVRCDQLLFGLEDVGPPQQELGRKPGGNGRRVTRVRLAGSGDRTGVASDQHRQRMFLGRDGLLERRNLLQRGFIFRPDLRHLEIGDPAGGEPRLEQLDGFPASLRRALRDTQLRVEVEKRDVTRDHG